jgi:hypothetical protein
MQLLSIMEFHGNGGLAAVIINIINRADIGSHSSGEFVFK